MFHHAEWEVMARDGSEEVVTEATEKVVTEDVKVVPTRRVVLQESSSQNCRLFALLYDMHLCVLWMKSKC